MTSHARQVLEEARKKRLQITTAESCTGGMVAAALTAIAGSSDVFDRGFVTYSNDAKIKMLNVSHDTLTKFGAVSMQTAQEMASGAIKHSAANIAVSITGIAGPGGSEHKPEGLVCFGISERGGETSAELIEFGALGRDIVRSKSVEHALLLLQKAINNWS